MKRKETSTKSVKNKNTSSSVKKSSIKSKEKAKDTKKQQKIIVLIGDSFYVASSKTQRDHYKEFEQKVKTQSTVEKKTEQRSTDEMADSLNLKQYVKTLSKAEKQQLFHDLQKEIQIQRQERSEYVEQLQNQDEDKLKKFNLKLESIRAQLMKGWEDEISKINHIFQNEQISLEDKNEKIILVQKIRNNKLAMVESIRVLFEKIMLEDLQLQINKQQHIEHIINSLNSFNSFSSFCHNSEAPVAIEIAQSPFQTDVPQISKQQIQRDKSDDELSKQFFQQEDHTIFKEQPEKIQNHLQLGMFKPQNLRLQIRLDQVEFGKDHYQDQNIQNKINKSKQKDTQQKQKKLIYIDNLPQEEHQQKISLASLSLDKKKLEEQFLCIDQTADGKIKIPLLMTKDRIEQLQFQKINKQKQTLAIRLKDRMAYQLSQMMPDSPVHFTTLMDINSFVVNFYEFVMQRFLREVIQGLNLAYGKSSLDKLFLIRHEGLVPDYDNYNILPEDLLSQYHKQFALSVRKLSQHQKIHNKAIFSAFNTGLNVYRPYYQLQGDVFPWNTSQKGLTFYQISEDNIEEVFQKSKMKVLQLSTHLCGILPNCQLTTAESKKQLEKRNQQCYEKVLKSQTVQKFGDWYVKVLNFEALSRLNIFQQIFDSQLSLFIQEVKNLSN